MKKQTHSVGHAGDGGAAAPEITAQQLVLYQDKAQVAFEAHEEKVKIKKGKTQKKRLLKDVRAYEHGQRDASSVVLGAKKLKA